MSEVEQKDDGDSFIIDTSECSASETEMIGGGELSGSEISEKVRSKKEDKTDPFLKIKMHALLGM